MENIKKKLITADELKVGDRIKFKMTKKLRLAQLEMLGAEYVAQKFVDNYSLYNEKKAAEVLQTVGDLRYRPAKSMWKKIFKQAGLSRSVSDKFVFVVHWHKRELMVKKVNPDYIEPEKNSDE